MAYDQKFEREQKDITKRLNVDYDKKRLLEEKAQIESDQKKERWAFIGLMILLVLSLIFWLLHRRQKKNEKRNAKESFVSEQTLSEEENNQDLSTKENLETPQEIDFLDSFDDQNKEEHETKNPQSSENESEKKAEVKTEEEIEEQNVEILKEEEEEDIAIIQPNVEPPKVDDYSEYLPINKDTAIQILKKLEQFEKRKKFLKKNVKLKTLSAEMNTNDKYLARVIKVKTGKIFTEYLRDLRFDYLNNLLESNPEIREMQIKDISNKLGYSHPESFTAHFREVYGVPPREYFRDDDEDNGSIPNPDI